MLYEQSTLSIRLQWCIQNPYWILRFAPVLTLLPLLTVAVPASYLPSREIAHYFQALAFAQDGLQSYGYVTARESGAALHLYSLIITPFIKVGHVTAGRYVSAIAALGATLLLTYIARELFDSKVAFFAPILLWANPFFYRFAWAYMPDSLTIFLTVAAVAAMVRYTQTDELYWYLASTAAIVLGIANHGWEATVLLPIAALLWMHEKRAHTLIYTATTLGAIIGVKYLVSLQPLPTTGNGYLVTSTGFGIYLSTKFWLGVITKPYSPFYLGHSLHFYPALVALVYWLINLYRNPNSRTATVLITWLMSGLAIPFALPGGLLHHYYLWALVAPVTLTTAAVLPTVINALRPASGELTASPVVRILVVILVCWTAMLGFVFESGALVGNAGAPPAVGDRHVDSDIPTSQAVMAGQQINHRSITDSNDIVFVSPKSEHLHRQTILRVLVHGNVLLRDVWVPEFTAETRTMPRSVSSRNEISECAVIVEKQGSTLQVSNC